MRLVFGLVLVLGLGLAGFAVYMAQGYISGYEQALAQERARARINARGLPLVECHYNRPRTRKFYAERLNVGTECAAVRLARDRGGPEGRLPDRGGGFCHEGPEVTRR